MKRSKLLSILVLVAVMFSLVPLTASATIGNADQPVVTETVGPNLLNNPGMEGKFIQQCSAKGGAPWVQVPCDPGNYDIHALDLWATADGTPVAAHFSGTNPAADGTMLVDVQVDYTFTQVGIRQEIDVPGPNWKPSPTIGPSPSIGPSPRVSPSRTS